MAFAPIARTMPQYENFQNQYLKAFDQGTTTPKVMATNETGDTTVSKFQLNAQGFPVTAGSALVIPFIDGPYDLWLIPTAAEADANDVTNSLQLADNITAIPAAGSGSTAVQELTTATMTANTSKVYTVGDVVKTAEFVTDAGDDGGGTYDVVLTSSVTPNAANIIIGVADATISFVLRLDIVSTKQFGAVADGSNDDGAALLITIAIAEANNARIEWPRGSYKTSLPLTITGVDVDFQKSTIEYTGAVGSFALTLNSSTGAGTAQRTGNRWSDFSLINEQWEEYVTFSDTKVYDPPGLPADANITNATPLFDSTTITVTGARMGGYVRATFDELIDGAVVTAEVTADDVVTVYFSNYTAAVIDMPSGTITANVVNNAYHGLNIGGSLGIVENYKVNGFTGVSFAVGSGICQISGVTFPAVDDAFYWETDGNVTQAAGYGFINQPRNNANLHSLSTFPTDAYGDHRAGGINQVVMSGLVNGFKKLSLEGSSSEEVLLITHATNLLRSHEPVYYEANPQWPTPVNPLVRAQGFSSTCDMDFRMGGELDKIIDEGVANDLSSSLTFYINGTPLQRGEGGENLIFNGDFINGINGWSDFSTGSTLTLPGDGVYTGKRVRLDIVSGRPNLQQATDQVGPALIAGLSGKTLTVGAWIRTDLSGMLIRVNGVSGSTVPNDSNYYFATSIFRVVDGSTDLDVSIIDGTASTQTGFVEISNVTGIIGTKAITFAPKTKPEGSATYNPPSIADGDTETTTVTVLGAALGDFVIGTSFSLTLAGLTTDAYVSATDTVTVVFTNNTGSPVDLGSGTLRVLVEKS